jgi:acetyltransferase
MGALPPDRGAAESTLSGVLHSLACPAPDWRLRPVRAHDADLLDAFFRALSPESRRRRFHVGVREIPLAWLERFTQPEPCDEVALLAVAQQADREICIGEARYARYDDNPLRREFAIAVADPWQGRGLGGTLLHRLMRHARRVGLEGLYGDVQRENAPMLQLARRAGLRLQRHPGDATLVRVAAELGSAARRNAANVPHAGIAATVQQPSAAAVWGRPR